LITPLLQVLSPLPYRAGHRVHPPRRQPLHHLPDPLQHTLHSCHLPTAPKTMLPSPLAAARTATAPPPDQPAPAPAPPAKPTPPRAAPCPSPPSQHPPPSTPRT